MPLELSEATKNKIEAEIIPQYPQRKSAILPAFWAIQDEKGCVDRDAMLYVADVLEVPASHVIGVLTFYTMIHQEPQGQYHIQVCRTASCEIMGSKGVVLKIKELLGIEVGETTPDGMFTLSEVECLGCCELAPMLQINKDNFGPLTPELVTELIEGLRNGTNRVEPCL